MRDQINCCYQPCPEMWALVGFVCFSSLQRPLLEAVIKLHFLSVIIIVLIFTIVRIMLQAVIKLPISHAPLTLQ